MARVAPVVARDGPSIRAQHHRAPSGEDMTDINKIIKRLAGYWLTFAVVVIVFASVAAGLLLFAFAPWPVKLAILFLWVTVIAGLIALK